MKSLTKKIVRAFGYDIVPHDPRGPKNLRWLGGAEREIVTSVQGYTMTSVERRIALMEAVNHVVDRKLQGAFVECGVWRGGSMMVIAKTLIARGDITRDLYLYDTYEGMAPPTEADMRFDGQDANKMFQEYTRKGEKWCFATLEDVEKNVLSTRYPDDRFRFVKGKVQDTIPGVIPERIALLRLDTDFYESTKHELQHLYSRLVSGGILILDDYDHWQGQRKAVDEFFAARGERPYLHRIDYSGRLMIKQ